MVSRGKSADENCVRWFFAGSLTRRRGHWPCAPYTKPLAVTGVPELQKEAARLVWSWRPLSCLRRCQCDLDKTYLVGGLEHEWIMTFHRLGMENHPN